MSTYSIAFGSGVSNSSTSIDFPFVLYNAIDPATILERGVTSVTFPMVTQKDDKAMILTQQNRIDFATKTLTDWATAYLARFIASITDRNSLDSAIQKTIVSMDDIGTSIINSNAVPMVS